MILSYREAAEAKKQEAALKKAQRDAELAAEEASLKTVKVAPKAGSKATKPAPVSRGLSAALASIDNDEPSSSSSAYNAKPSALNATGIDNALDALSITTSSANPAFERHPERRFKAAFAAYEERRMKEGKEDGEFAGLRQNQIQTRLRKEFEKSEENPFNQGGNVAYDASKEEIKSVREKERDAIENRLTEKGAARK